MHGLFLNLLVATIMMTWTVSVHFFGIVFLLRLLSAHSHHVDRYSEVVRQILLLIVAVLGIVALHTVEIWSYAFVYILVGALDAFEPALYFSTVSFTTLGFGDIVLDHKWRILSAIEGANGLILFGWSTAFLISLMRKLRALEHEWLER
jgi:Ion channel